MQALVDGPGHTNDIKHLLKVSLLVLLLPKVSADLRQIYVLATESGLKLAHGSVRPFI